VAFIEITISSGSKIMIRKEDVRMIMPLDEGMRQAAFSQNMNLPDNVHSLVTSYDNIGAGRIYVQETYDELKALMNG
jgi:hypothetical protein